MDDLGEDIKTLKIEIEKLDDEIKGSQDPESVSVPKSQLVEMFKRNDDLKKQRDEIRADLVLFIAELNDVQEKIGIRFQDRFSGRTIAKGVKALINLTTSDSNDSLFWTNEMERLYQKYLTVYKERLKIDNPQAYAKLIKDENSES